MTFATSASLLQEPRGEMGTTLLISQDSSLAARTGLGRLDREDLSFSFPLTTSHLVSAILGSHKQNLTLYVCV